MANGLLSELRRLAESSRDIPQEAVNRLILGALAEVVARLDTVTESGDSRAASMDDLKDKMDEMDQKLNTISSELTAIKTNPIVSLGSFVKRHPKTSLVIFLLSIAAIAILVTSKPFVIMMLTLAGIPSEAIEQLLVLVYH